MAKIRTETQISAGGVAFRRFEEDIQVVIVLVGKKKRWQLPKGIVDKGENVEEAALREVREEAGIQAKLIDPIETIEYWYVAKNKGIPIRFHKFVHFFLMEYESGDVLQHDHEVLEARWVSLAEAKTMLAFKGEKEVVAKAEQMLAAPVTSKKETASKNKNDLLLVSWNVNGFRAIVKKGFADWLAKTQPDLLCIQETKCSPDILSANLREPAGYFSFWATAEKQGYAGTAIYTKYKPLKVHTGIGIEEFDLEGRTIAIEFKTFILVNGYFPNGGSKPERATYKMRYKAAFIKFCQKLRKQKPVIFCGDLNTAHKAIDVARPKTKKNKSGFLKEERNWIDQILDAGYIDTFRAANPTLTGAFTCWPYSRNSRERNIGWRLDYIFVDKAWKDKIHTPLIHNFVMGSDHCPISLNIRIRSNTQ